MSFGHTASSAVATNAVLELPVSAGMSFVSASDGGTLVAGKVQWNLGTLQPGQVGKRQATFTVDALGSLETGVIRKLEASLRDASGRLVRADDTTRIETEAPLILNLDVTSNPGQPADTLNVALTVTNSSAFNRSGVALSMRYPLGLAALADSLITGGGSCKDVIGNYYSCEATEILTWNLGTLPANSTVTRSLPPKVVATLLKGSLIEFTSWVEDATASSRSTQILRIGNEVAPPVDSDGDGVADNVDKCTLIANPDQRDTNGDGYGNVCDADLDNNGVVNTFDLALFKSAFGKTGTGLDADLDGNGVVNTLDLAKFKSLFGKVPGPSGVAP